MAKKKTIKAEAGMQIARHNVSKTILIKFTLTKHHACRTSCMIKMILQCQT